MLTDRQKRIFNICIDCLSKKKIITSSELASELDVTTRTIGKDIILINSEIRPYGMEIQTISGKGYFFAVDDFMKMEEYLQKLIESEQGLDNVYDSKEKRINHLIGTLLFARKPISAMALSDELYISRSQLSIDMNDAKKVLDKYSLKIMTKTRQGFYIKGTEFNKRLCLIRENINVRRYGPGLEQKFTRKMLSNIIINAISSEHYEISDLALQNLILHVDTSLIRIMVNEDIEEFEIEYDLNQIEKEMIISTEIYERIAKILRLQVSKREVVYLAINLLSKRMHSDDDIIADETNILITNMFSCIQSNYGIDFSDNIELRLNLALHLQSLIIRAKNHLMMKNIMLTVIKQSLTLAYDIAVLAANCINKAYDIKLTQDEIGYLAIYFNMELINLSKPGDKVDVLIITNHRKSESLLFRYNFMKHFSEYVRKLEIVNVSDLNQVNVDDYRAIFTTIENHSIKIENHELHQINYFLSGQDILFTEEILQSLRHASSIHRYFSRDCFFHETKKISKNEILKKLCNAVSIESGCKENIYDLVKKREAIASTYFGNAIALPHPEHLVAEKTLIAVAVLDQPTKWTKENDEVSIICLMNVRKGGEKEMRVVYDFLSSFIQNKKYISSLKETPTFDTLHDIMESYKPQNLI